MTVCVHGGAVDTGEGGITSITGEPTRKGCGKSGFMLCAGVWTGVCTNAEITPCWPVTGTTWQKIGWLDTGGGDRGVGGVLSCAFGGGAARRVQGWAAAVGMWWQGELSAVCRMTLVAMARQGGVSSGLWVEGGGDGTGWSALQL